MFLFNVIAKTWLCKITICSVDSETTILVPRGRDPCGQPHGSRPLGGARVTCKPTCNRWQPLLFQFSEAVHKSQKSDFLFVPCQRSSSIHGADHKDRGPWGRECETTCSLMPISIWKLFTNFSSF